jgi:hypothetical protein
MSGGVRRIVGLVAVGLVGLAACSADSDSSSESAAGEPEQNRAPAVAASTGADRDVVQNGQLVVSVVDVAEAGDRATDVVEEAGGFLFSQDSDLEDDPEVRITFKVPSERFRPVLDRLGDIGRTLSRTSSAQDVTDQVVDLDGRLASAQASADRLRALIADAASTAEIIAVEKELEAREAEIESMQGRLRVLRDRADMATIEARFTAQEELEVSSDLPGFLDGLRTGLVALLTGGLVVLTLAGFVLPFAPFAVAGRWGWVRYRRRHPKPPSSPPPPPTFPQWSPRPPAPR